VASASAAATPSSTPTGDGTSTGTPTNGTATGTATAGASTPEVGGSVQPDFGGYLEGIDGGYEDMRGQDEVTVTVGADGNGGSYAFSPAGLWISPGTTVTFEWVSDNHNMVVEDGPDGGWGGYETVEMGGFTTSHTFETGGIYTYFCSPHQSQGMQAGIAVGPDVATVEESSGGGGGSGGSSGGGDELTIDDIHEMGVPFQAHWVGLATLLMILVSLLYTFFLLKYGTSPHASGGND
jgi:halocyanin-like protein